ncbi:MAG: cytochrome C oxidase subunit II [Bacillus thermozeamaize]|jgi:cytochrome c oxidase subunit 2|uniref:Cytochrome aa3 subunit 2 n=1 Tax=Bacillus thermozeamaize TaxID=230954 RepID=A0A1Y3PF13_9BACI|nr:MAG: cytochrome C oxidase subunit II [Bacillus thermozeamaize]
MHMHRYERIWLIFGGATLIAFLAVLAVQTFALGLTPPSDLDQACLDNPNELAPPYNKPGVYKVGDNEYDVVMVSFAFGFQPGTIEVPAGTKINFKATSKDVVHGFQIPGTNVNMMLMPGHANTVSYTFKEPGEYLILCNEYCGIGHQAMMGKVIVN